MVRVDLPAPPFWVAKATNTGSLIVLINLVGEVSATFATGVARLDNRVRVNSSSASRPAYVISQKECQATQSESEQVFIHMFIHISIHMVIHMAIHMVIHMNVDVFRHSNEGMKVCTFIHLSRCQDI